MRVAYVDSHHAATPRALAMSGPRATGTATAIRVGVDGSLRAAPSSSSARPSAHASAPIGTAPIHPPVRRPPGSTRPPTPRARSGRARREPRRAATAGRPAPAWATARPRAARAPRSPSRAPARPDGPTAARAALRSAAGCRRPTRAKSARRTPAGAPRRRARCSPASPPHREDSRPDPDSRRLRRDLGQHDGGVVTPRLRDLDAIEAEGLRLPCEPHDRVHTRLKGSEGDTGHVADGPARCRARQSGRHPEL